MASDSPENPPSRPFFLFSVGPTSYELVRYLGPRGAGEVLLARRHYAEMPGDLVVIKRLSDPEDGFGKARLREEVKLMLRLRHPAIGQMYLVRSHEGTPHLVMEYVEGHSLETLISLAALRRRPFSEAFAAHVGAEIADALHHAHSQVDASGASLGIVHRDVNPRVVRLDTQGRARLSDFSVAWSRLPGRVQTAEPALQGDLSYASPEAFRLQPLDGRADLFSLGVVLLELLTGLHLLDLEDVERAAQSSPAPPGAEGLRAAVPSWLPASQLATRMACVAPEHVERATRNLSSGMRAIVQRLLRREPAERFQTGLEVRDALLAVLAGQGRTYGPREARREVAQVRREARSRRRGADVLRLEDGGTPGCAPRMARPAEG